MSARVIVADSAAELREEIVGLLRRECFEVDSVADGEAALVAAVRGAVDCLLLDLDLRRVSGLDVLRRLRAVSTVPVIALSRTDRDVERVVALELGADDCVPLPCSPAELVGRVRALLRRCEFERRASRGPVRELDGIRIDLGQREVEADGQQVHLTQAEFKLLSLLTEVPGRTVTRREILHRLWGPNHGGYEHVCDVHVSNLRRKIERDPSNPLRIVTLRGIGYRFAA